jgi:hypothetical protein
MSKKPGCNVGGVYNYMEKITVQDKIGLVGLYNLKNLKNLSIKHINDMINNITKPIDLRSLTNLIELRLQSVYLPNYNIYFPINLIKVEIVRCVFKDINIDKCINLEYLSIKHAYEKFNLDKISKCLKLKYLELNAVYIDNCHNWHNINLNTLLLTNPKDQLFKIGNNLLELSINGDYCINALNYLLNKSKHLKKLIIRHNVCKSIYVVTNKYLSLPNRLEYLNISYSCCLNPDLCKQISSLNHLKILKLNCLVNCVPFYRSFNISDLLSSKSLEELYLYNNSIYVTNKIGLFFEKLLKVKKSSLKIISLLYTDNVYIYRDIINKIIKEKKIKIKY